MADYSESGLREGIISEGDINEVGKGRLTVDPAPEAFMIRDLITSAGEQTVVATVPCLFKSK